jgi:hypothetical protein
MGVRLLRNLEDHIASNIVSCTYDTGCGRDWHLGTRYSVQIRMRLQASAHKQARSDCGPTYRYLGPILRLYRDCDCRLKHWRSHVFDAVSATSLR